MTQVDLRKLRVAPANKDVLAVLLRGCAAVVERPQFHGLTVNDHNLVVVDRVDGNRPHVSTAIRERRQRRARLPVTLGRTVLLLVGNDLHIHAAVPRADEGFSDGRNREAVGEHPDLAPSAVGQPEDQVFASAAVNGTDWGRATARQRNIMGRDAIGPVALLMRHRRRRVVLCRTLTSLFRSPTSRAGGARTGTAKPVCAEHPLSRRS